MELKYSSLFCNSAASDSGKSETRSIESYVLLKQAVAETNVFNVIMVQDKRNISLKKTR